MRNLFFLLIFFYSLNILGQSLSKSEPFKEKYKAKFSILQLENLHTFLIEDVNKQGLNLKLYNEYRKTIRDEKIESKLIPDVGNFSSGIISFFEVNNEAILFYKRTDKGVHKLIGLRFDSKNGKIIEEKIITELNGNEYENYFRVVKDPYSDYYAIFLIKLSEGIEVLHMNSEHKIINKIYYKSPSDKYKYFEPISFYVHKNEFILISSKTYSTISPSVTFKYYISKADKGETAFENKELNYLTNSNSFIYTDMLYNKKLNLIHLFSIKHTQRQRSEHEEVYFNNIQTNELQIGNNIKIDSTVLMNYYKNDLGRKNEFYANIKNYHVDDNGNILMLFNNVKEEYSDCSEIKDIGVLKISSDGVALKSYVFPYHFEFCSTTNPFFTSTMYFNSSENSTYILLNDIKENVYSDNKKEAKIIRQMNHTNSVMYTMSEESTKIKFLEPNPVKEFNCLLHDISNYNYKLKTYCTVMDDIVTKEMNLVWIKLD